MQTYIPTHACRREAYTRWIITLRSQGIIIIETDDSTHLLYSANWWSQRWVEINRLFKNNLLKRCACISDVLTEWPVCITPDSTDSLIPCYVIFLEMKVFSRITLLWTQKLHKGILPSIGNKVYVTQMSTDSDVLSCFRNIKMERLEENEYRGIDPNRSYSIEDTERCNVGRRNNMMAIEVIYNYRNNT